MATTTGAADAAAAIPKELDLPRDRVNPHLMDHMVAASATHEVQASEDILNGQGVKLLAKGARISGDMRERLLQHKLAKPLEESVQIVDGVMPGSFGPLAERLQDEYPLIAALCRHERARPVSESLASLNLTVPVQALLTLYANHQGDRLAHSVGVAMIGIALARRLRPDDIERHRQLALAGLLHDVGELYIDPAYMRPDTPLEPEMWRHIASHPVIGWRVLKDMPGAGPVVAEAVLQHHERLDGFGYPRGIADEEFTLDGQILATAEWLMGLIDSGVAPRARATIVAKLMPGEFGAPLMEALKRAADTDEGLGAWMENQQRPLQELLPRVERQAATFRNFHANRAWIEQQAEAAEPAMRRLLRLGVRRMLRIQAAFSSTGLDAGAPERMLQSLAELSDPEMHQELLVLVREFGWRMQELERESLLRASLLGEANLGVMRELITRMREGVPG